MTDFTSKNCGVRGTSKAGFVSQRVIVEGSQGIQAVMKELPCNNVGVKSLGNYFANESIRVSRAAVLHSED